ncbi:hypothetical protein AB6848_11250 [Serratia proteamaculans]|uniref:hypothetical protein n=1 Tax=Serratia proteamaculans TaxID=28151 RepID=UPI0039BDF7FB
MTKALIEFTPDHHDKQQEAMARYHAKLDALRSVLIDRGACESKQDLEAIAENISAAFGKIELTPVINGKGKSEEKDNEFERLIRPVIKYLAENHHPHTHIVVTSTHAELSEGVQAVATDEYLL